MSFARVASISKPHFNSNSAARLGGWGAPLDIFSPLEGDGLWSHPHRERQGKYHLRHRNYEVVGHDLRSVLIQRNIFIHLPLNLWYVGGRALNPHEMQRERWHLKMLHFASCSEGLYASNMSTTSKRLTPLTCEAVLQSSTSLNQQPQYGKVNG